MTAEELWEKKGMIGLAIVFLIFAGGLVFMKNVQAANEGVATLVQIKKIGAVTIAYDLRVIDQKQKRGFKERIINPQGKFKAIKEKKEGDKFLVAYGFSEQGRGTITKLK